MHGVNDRRAIGHRNINHLPRATAPSTDAATDLPSRTDFGFPPEEIERLMLKFLLARGSASGRKIAQQVCLSFGIIEPLLRSLKSDQLVSYRQWQQEIKRASERSRGSSDPA